MDLWAETIISTVREKLPSTKDMSLKVSFLKKDEELGTATGSVEILNRKLNKTVYVPIIAKNFKMSPLDVLMVPDKKEESGFDVLPLTQDYFENILFNNKVFDHLGKPLDRMRQLYGNTQGNLFFPPNYRNIYASAQIFDAIKDTVWKSDADAVINTIKQNPEVLVGYEKRSNLDILKKIAQVKGAEASKENLIKNISIIKKDLSDNYKVTTVSDQAFDPIIESIDEQELHHDLKDKVERPEDTIHEVERNGEKMLFSELSPQSTAMVYGGGDLPQNYQNVNEQPQLVKVFGAYKVQDKNGVFHKGVVVPNMIDFNMKVLPHKVFLSCQKSAFQDSIAGIPIEGESPMRILTFREPEVGVTGTFVVFNDTNALATYPITIRSMMKEGGYCNIIATDLSGKTIKIKKDNWGGCDPLSSQEEKKRPFASKPELQKITKVKDFYIMPGKFKFVPMDNLTSLTENVIIHSLKTAASVMDGAPVRVIHTGYSQFAVKGPDMTKMASKLNWDTTNLSASQTVFLLAAKKCPLEKIAGALKIAGKIGESSIHGLPRVTWGEKVRAEQTKIASSILKIVNGLKANLVKEASFFEDSQVVDSVLSLNFINPQNVNKFVNFIPVYEQTIKMLAQTLMASRLGMSEIPEQSTSTAMFKMIDVVKGLKRLELRNKGE
jgi:hypothetical protein